jgi:hypothetical protein
MKQSFIAYWSDSDSEDEATASSPTGAIATVKMKQLLHRLPNRP